MDAAAAGLHPEAGRHAIPIDRPGKVMVALRLAGLLVLVLFALSWLVLSLTGDKAELKLKLDRAELNRQQQTEVLAQVERQQRNAMKEIDDAQRDKAGIQARSAALQRELARLQVGHACAAEPVPAAVVDRLRERVAAANAAAQGGAVAPAGPVPDTGL